MKNYFILTILLISELLFAQPYNITYSINANNDSLNKMFVIVNNLQESVTVSNGKNSLTNSNYFILTKLSVAGTTMYNIVNRAPNDPAGGYVHVEALHETPDEGVIVGGYYYEDRNNVIEQPFLAKFDAAGNVLWNRIYPVNYSRIVRPDINKVSLCRVYDDAGENYFFVVAGDSDANPGNEVVTNVLKVDGITGNLVFSNKYYNTSPDEFTDLREYPGDIEYSSRDRMYMITGYRAHVRAETGVPEYLMYYFGITNNGSLYTYFTTLRSNSIPIDQDMVYDAVNDHFATVFTHDANGYVPAKRSLIGFVNVNSALSIFDPGCIWHDEGNEHNGRSISHRANGEYVLGTGIGRTTTPFERNPALQMVTNSGMPASFFMRYNIDDNTYFSHHTWHPTRDEFVLVGEQNTDLRVVSTDPGGNACGIRTYVPKYQQYVPDQKFYNYYPVTNWEHFPHVFNQEWRNVPFRTCLIPPGDSYRTTGLTNFTAGQLNLRVYPSVVSKNNAELTIENNSGAELSVEVRSVTGQLTQSVGRISSDKTTVTLNQDLSPGVYLIHFFDKNGNISATEKIVISE